MSLKHKLALEASAGSGKTFALSVRYIALLLQGADPARIVALTFTKKAANEMKERVYETLEELSHKEAELKSLCALLECSPEEVLAKRDTVLPTFLSASIHIETIDAFLGKILRKFSLHLGVMPDFVSENAAHERHLKTTFLQSLKSEGAYDALVHFLATEKMRVVDLLKLFNGLYEKASELGEYHYPRSVSPRAEAVMSKVAMIRHYIEEKKGSKTALNSFPLDIVAFQSKPFLERDTLDYRTFSKIYSPELDALYFEVKELLQEYNAKKEAYLLGELFAFYRLYERSRLKLAKEKAN